MHASYQATTTAVKLSCAMMFLLIIAPSASAFAMRRILKDVKEGSKNQWDGKGEDWSWDGFKSSHYIKAFKTLDTQTMKKDLASGRKSLTTNGQEYFLDDLEPYNVLAPSFQATLDGEVVTLPAESPLQKGVSANGDGIFVAKDFDGNITEVAITSADSTTHLVNLQDPTNPDSFATVHSDDYDWAEINRMFSLEHDDLNELMEGYSAPDQKAKGRRLLQAACTSYDTIEVAVAHDSSFCSRMGGAERAATEVQRIIGATSVRYEQRGLCVRVRLAYLDQQCNSRTDVYRDMVNSRRSGCGGDGQLQAFRDHWVQHRDHVRRDVAHLFTSTSMDGNTIGCAWTNSLCHPNYAYGVNNIGFTGDFNQRVVLFAHELGHNAGAPHTNHNGNFVMRPYINSGSQGFASDTVNSIRSFLRDYGTCAGSDDSVEDRYTLPYTDWDAEWTRECAGGDPVVGLHSYHSNHREDRRWILTCSDITGADNAQCQPWTGWANSWDGELDFTCPNNHFISGVRSYHDNRVEDRLFAFKCCQHTHGGHDMLTQVSGWTDYQNGWDGALDYETDPCRVIIGVNSYHGNHQEDRRFRFRYASSCTHTGELRRYEVQPETNWDASWTRQCHNHGPMVGMVSNHDNRREDRRFMFHCSEVGGTGGAQCQPWTGWANWWDGHLDFTCPTDHFISGVRSYHDNPTEDRRFAFHCCRYPGVGLTGVSGWTDYQNGWDGHLNWATDRCQVMVGINSHHENNSEDRRFRFRYASIC